MTIRRTPTAPRRLPPLGVWSLATLASLGLGGACRRPMEMAGVGTRNLGALFDSPRRLPNRIHQPYRADARLSALWVGHATVLLQLDDRWIMTDPVFTDAVGQLSPRLVEPGMDVRDVPRLDAVLISHMHFDHLSFGSLALLEDRIGRLLVPQDALTYVPNYRFPATELAPWQRWERNGLAITAVPVRHVGWRYGADESWMRRSFTGYVIEYRGLTVYFGGDSAYDQDMFARTSQRFPHIDLALIPIAPIEPREFMASRHMDPPEALRAFRDLGAERMIPIHFDTFINSLDRPGDAVAALRRAMAEQQVPDERVLVLEIGEQRVVIGR